MSEQEFYDLCDRIDEVDVDVTQGYYPTIEDLIAHDVKNRIKTNKDYLKFVIYYSTDPLSRFGYSDAENEDYRSMVKYVRGLILELDLK